MATRQIISTRGFFLIFPGEQRGLCREDTGNERTVIAGRNRKTGKKTNLGIPGNTFPGNTIFMARELSTKDIEILKKLAPECGDLTCGGSGHQFHAILPPVSNHFAEDADDFTKRISRLSDEELAYIAEKILTGEEGLGCLEVEDVESTVKLIHDRISPEMAKKVIAAYESGAECDR